MSTLIHVKGGAIIIALSGVGIHTYILTYVHAEVYNYVHDICTYTHAHMYIVHTYMHIRTYIWYASVRHTLDIGH